MIVGFGSLLLNGCWTYSTEEQLICLKNQHKKLGLTWKNVLANVAKVGADGQLSSENDVNGKKNQNFGYRIPSMPLAQGAYFYWTGLVGEACTQYIDRKTELIKNNAKVGCGVSGDSSIVIISCIYKKAK